MWLVLCDAEDKAARWAYEGLRERGLAPLELVSSRHLVHAPRSAHRLDGSGADFGIDLPDGRTLAAGRIDGVLNRLSWAPVGDIVFATRADTLYAREEVSALLLSWLASIASVMVNRPSTRGLSGAWRSPAEWSVLAARAGLPVATLRLGGDAVTGTDMYSPTHSVVVLGEQVFGDVGDLAPACVRLARSARADLLGVDLRLGDWSPARFTRATVLPDLRIGGSALIEALYGHLIGLPAVRRA
ncbi:hypothetical protein ACFZC7_31220 [Streptomyces massasporeus]|uniref:hypothetical protein n=1 Tax=Streptomyces massasporeus TaxID=67324 RepID=UPI0036E11CBA